MERSTSVNPDPGEQNLTPGEQKILTLLERVQQGLEQRMERMDQQMGRMDQHLNSLEKTLGEQGKQLHALTIKVEEEAANSAMRDRQLSVDLQNLQEESQERDRHLLVRLDRNHQETLNLLDKQLNTLRNDFSERFNQHNTRLKMLEQTVRLISEQNPETDKRLQVLTEEVRNLTARLELKADASRVAALEQRLGE